MKEGEEGEGEEDGVRAIDPRSSSETNSRGGPLHEDEVERLMGLEIAQQLKSSS